MGSRPEPVGVRVARLRKRRGLTQVGLAQRTTYSRSHIAQVEKDHKVATPAFVAAVASALGVSSAEVFGQPYPGESGRDEAVHAPIAEIRRSLVFVEVPPELEGPPRPVEVLAAELVEVCRLQAASRHTQVGVRLPALIEELTWHAHAGEDACVWALLFRAHEAAADLCRKLGYHDLANGCLEAARVSAVRAGDPHLEVLVTLRRSLLLAAVAQWSPALLLLERAARQVDPGRVDAGEILGTAGLRSAVIAARAGDGTSAWDYFGRAVEIREEMGEDPGDRHGVTTGFTRANVAIHGAAVAVELGDLDEAARRDREIGEPVLGTLVPERRAHHEIDMSRMLVETGDYDRALGRLLSAERTAPQMTRFHPSARSVVGHLIDVRRTLPEPLRALQNRMGV